VSDSVNSETNAVNGVSAEAFSLIQQAKQSNAEALGELLDSCRGYLLLVADQKLSADLKVKVAASDIVQEAYLKAHENIAQFRGQSSEEFLAWMRKILLNTFLNKRRRYVGATRQISQEKSEGAVNLNSLAIDASSPSTHAIRDEEAEHVFELLQELPEDYQRIIRLRSRDELSYAEIAQQMGRSTDAVRLLWSRAIEALTRKCQQN